MLSYAQNGEDVVLQRVFADRGQGFYVDVGACDPVEDSVTLHFYRQGWSGVNVEPDPRYHAMLVEARPRDVNLQAAVGSGAGQATFYPTGTRGQGTLDPEVAAQRSAAPTATVDMVPLGEILARHAPPEGIDFLKVDVEGWEAAVLGSADLRRHRPRVVLVEAVNAAGLPTHAAWEPALLGAGYVFGLFDGLNRFYCREEDAAALLPRLAAPANVLDNWRLAREVRAQEALQAALAAEQAAHAGCRAAVEAGQAALEAEQAAHAGTRAALAAEQAAHVATRAAVEAGQSALAAEQAAHEQTRATLAAERDAQARLRAALAAEHAAHAATRAALEAGQAALAREREAHAGARAAAAAYEASTCWRITAPLRDTVRLARLFRRGA
jgi:FkbM family methyltransferase